MFTPLAALILSSGQSPHREGRGRWMVCVSGFRLRNGRCAASSGRGL